MRTPFRFDPLREHNVLKRRVERLEKRPLPAASSVPAPTGDGKAQWVTGGYQGLILETSNLMNYYRFTDVGGASFLKDWYGGVLPSNLTVTVGVAPNVPVTLNHTSPSVTQLANDDFSALYTAVNPSGVVAGDDSHSDIYVMGSGAGDQTNVARWAGGNISTATWECWIRPDPTAPGQNPGKVGPIISGLSGLNGAYIYWDYTLGAGQNTLVFAGAAGTRIRTAVLATGAWYHVVATISSGIMSMYVNGVLVGVGTISENIGVALWRIGGQQFAVFESFQGAIAEVATYNRALTASEILLHYNAKGPSTDTGRWITVPFSSGALATIGTGDIAAGAVTSTQILDGTIQSNDIATGAITTTQILDGTVGAIDLSATIKPSGSAAETTEALRALGTTTGLAMKGTDGRAAKATPAYSASITMDSSAGAWQTITATNATAFTINAPTNPPSATQTQELTIEISNTSGGALGAITWNAIFVFTNGAFVAPANTKKRSITFGWNGLAWIEQSRTAIDY